jgi:hypothetical protein
MNLDDLDHITNPGVLPAAPRALHELAVQHELPFLIAAVPTPDSPEHYGLLVEVAAGACSSVVAGMLRDIAGDLEAMHEQHA